MTAWTTPADVRVRVRRRWDDGSLLGAYVRGEPCPPFDLPVRGPAAREIGADLARVRTWQEALLTGSQGGRAFDVQDKEVGGRAIGRMSLPARVHLTRYEQCWRVLGAGAEVARLDAVVAASRETHPALMGWIARRARTAIEVADEWPRLLAAHDWLLEASGQGHYLREVTAAGVDTKFIERHQRVLAELLTESRGLAPGDGCADTPLSGQTPPWEAAPSRRRSFAGRFGFREPERLIHLRLDPALGALPGGIDEVALPLPHASNLAIAPERVLVIENRVTYLSVPMPKGGAVIWGRGFDALRLGHVPWLGDAATVTYWGDLDTHGFAILSGLRMAIPRVQSILMDQATLLAHATRWVHEPKPTRADLTALDVPERRLYEELVDDTYGPRVRLEQERVDWSYALRALAADTSRR